jgi:hypothetical protein
MRTFQEFISLCEATGDTYDAEFRSGAQIIKTGPEGRTGRLRRKTDPETRRVKAVGGGKTVPAKRYKTRKDVGKKRESTVQAPTQERGSAREAQLAAAKEERRKAALARRSGAKPSSAKPSAKEASKTASELLRKKPAAKAPAAGYKAPKASGMSRAERNAQTKKGERTLRDIVLQSTGKKSEKELKHKYTSK